MMMKKILDRLARLFGFLPNPEFERIMKQTDAKAIRSDWEAVGKDLWWAIRAYEKKKMEDNDANSI